MLRRPVATWLAQVSSGSHIALLAAISRRSKATAVVNPPLDDPILDRPNGDGSPYLPFTSIPALPSYPVIGSALAISAHDPSKRKQQYHLAQVAIHNKLGPLVRVQLPGRPHPSVWIADPTMVAEAFQNESKYPMRPSIDSWTYYRERRQKPLGLVLANGPEWRRVRSAAQGLIFNPQKAQRAFVKCVNAPTRLGLDKIEEHLRAQGEMAVQGKQTVDIDNLVMRWSIEAISTILLGRSLGTLADPPNPIAQRTIAAFVTLFRTLGPLTQTPGWAWKLRLTKTARQHFFALDEIHTICDQLTKDVLAELAALPLEELEGTFLGHILARKGELSFEEMMIMTVEFLGGGVDTTSRTALNAMHLLGRNPRVQEMVRQEILAVVGPDKDLDVSEYSKLKYLKNILKETFRMIPTIPVNSRILTQDAVLGGYIFPAGTNLMFNHFVMSHDPKLVANPDQFLPERWDTKTIHPAVVMPFGSGSRKCIGFRLAEIELHALFVHLLRRFELVAAPEEMELVATTGLAPMGSTPLRLKLRPNAA